MNIVNSISKKEYLFNQKRPNESHIEVTKDSKDISMTFKDILKECLNGRR
jgi:hypothetical protein